MDLSVSAPSNYISLLAADGYCEKNNIFLYRFDCGMFMIKYADFYSRDIGLCFSQVSLVLHLVFHYSCVMTST